MKVWIVLLKVFGYIWLTAVGLLILAGAAGTWREGGFSAVQELLSLFNIVNWLVTVITLAPGFGALTWAKKLKTRLPIGPDKPAQFVQGDRVKASQSWEAMQKLVNHYGAILERSSGDIVSEELLPASKQEIKQLLIAVVRVLSFSGNMSTEMMEHFRWGYASLAKFVSHEEAEIMKRYYSLLRAAPEIKDSSDPRILEIAKGLEDNRFIEIQQRSHNKFARLIQKFDAAVKV